MHTLILHDNVQFIYELALARLELDAFQIPNEVDGDYRTFRTPHIPHKKECLRRIAYFKSVDGDTADYHYIQKQNVTRSVNQYLTHWFYPYKGKYHPQMVRALLNIVGARRGDVILDPFIGSGTTALECQLVGVNCLGIDASPLCVLISKVKTQSLDVLPLIRKAVEDQGVDSLSLAPRPAQGATLLPRHRPPSRNGKMDERVLNFLSAAALIAESDVSRRRRDFRTSFEKAIRRMIASLESFDHTREQLNLQLAPTDVRVGDARRLPFPANSVDGIICSPPYSIALDYVENDAHALGALGYDLDRMRDKFIGVRGKGRTKLDMYENDMERSLAEMYRVLKDGKSCVVVIGNITYQGNELDTVGMSVEKAQRVGFELQHSINKTIFGLYNVMQREKVLVFQKPQPAAACSS